MIDWTRYPNFSERELACKGTGMFNMSERFLGELQNLRTRFGRPMEPTSACRSKEHNENVGGHPRSLHVCDAPHYEGQDGCIAIDIEIQNGGYRGDLVSIAWSLGWSVGWGGKKGFVHLDRRDFLGMKPTTFDY